MLFQQLFFTKNDGYDDDDEVVVGVVIRRSVNQSTTKTKEFLSNSRHTPNGVPTFTPQQRRQLRLKRVVITLMTSFLPDHHHLLGEKHKQFENASVPFLLVSFACDTVRRQRGPLVKLHCNRDRHKNRIKTIKLKKIFF
jgi:hypothetical protein